MNGRKTRLNDAISHLKATGSIRLMRDVARDMGVDPATVSQAVNGREKYLTDSFLKKFIAAYFTFSPDWLLYGRGPMFRGEAEPREAGAANYLNVPFVGVPALALYPAMCRNPLHLSALPTFPVVADSSFTGQYRCFEVAGDAMEGGTPWSLCDRDIVLCRSVVLPAALSCSDGGGRLCAVVYDKGVMVRDLMPAGEGMVVCRASNPRYGDMVLPAAEIIELFTVDRLVDRRLK